MSIYMEEADMDRARAKAAEQRNRDGGVVGNFTPKEITIEVKDLTAEEANAIELKVPAGKFVYGAYVKNLANDLGGSGTLTVKVGNTTLLNAVTAANLKGKGVAALNATPAFVAEKSNITLTPSAAYTAGKVTVGIIYG